MATEASRAVLTVDLGAIVENHRRLRRQAPGSEVAAMWQGGARTFFVAHPEEGVALRSALPDATIFVLHGLQRGSGEDLADAALIPVLNHPGELARYVALSRRRKRRLPAALQIDSGMCRPRFS